MNFKIITNEEQTEILTENHEKFEWGWFYPPTATGGLGARLIMEDGGLSVLTDRVVHLDKDKHTDIFLSTRAVDMDIIKKLEKFMNDNDILSKGSDRIFGEEAGIKVLATPNGSHGYVYLSIWTEFVL